MKHLTLLRHARAATRTDPAVRDFNRPLDPVGEEEAAFIGGYMRAQGVEPDLALCSPSLRTRQTFENLAPYLAAAPRLLLSDRLYNASPETMLEEIAAAPDASSLLVIGHNPGVHLAALMIAHRGQSSRALVDRLESEFPTGMLAYFGVDFDHWTDIARRGATLLRLQAPRISAV